MKHSVLIAGSGPTGMMLAAELALARVDVAIVERRATQAVDGTRARGIHARSIELLDQRGVAPRFLEAGKPMQIAGFAHVPLDISRLPTRHAYGLAISQARIEQLLAAWIAELGVPVYREREVTGLVQDDDGVEVQLGGESLRAAYVVGCDGGRSMVRKQAGIELAGTGAATSYLIAECELEGAPYGMRRDDVGIHGIGPLEDGVRVGVVSTEERLRQGEQPTIDELRAALVRVWGTDLGVHGVTWLSRFTDAALQASSYRAGRVLLAGDAAHVHSPVGGQGLNLGLQDAVNLGWKLAQVVHGVSPESLLDTYQAEQHPVAARVLRLTLAQSALHRGDARTSAVRDTMMDLVGLPEARTRWGATMSGLDLRYDLGEGHALLGRRMPDLEVVTERGAQRVFELLHEASAVLLDLGALEVGAWNVQHVKARYDGPWELPALGAVPAPAAVLIRPDGHVAWVGDGTEDGLHDALARWCGPRRRLLATPARSSENP